MASARVGRAPLARRWIPPPQPTPLTARNSTKRAAAAAIRSNANRVGPAHRGVYGRKAASAPNFNYSTAVKSSTVFWEEKTLDAWLTNPQAPIPGQHMNFRVAAPEDRADIIAYLRQQSHEQHPN